MKDDGLVIGRLMNGEEGRRKAEGWWEVVLVRWGLLFGVGGAIAIAEKGRKEKRSEADNQEFTPYINIRSWNGRLIGRILACGREQAVCGWTDGQMGRWVDGWTVKGTAGGGAPLLEQLVPKAAITVLGAF
jgi:hypothetical protein